jgi:protease IV
VGGEKEAIAWLEKEKNLAKDLPVREWRKRSGFEELGLSGAAARLIKGMGFERLAGSLERIGAGAEILSLDGMLAVWQPALEN